LGTFFHKKIAHNICIDTQVTHYEGHFAPKKTTTNKQKTKQIKNKTKQNKQPSIQKRKMKKDTIKI